MQGGSPKQNGNVSNERIMQLTPEEEKVMVEMRRQTFFTHVMPLSGGSLLGMSMLIRKGAISQSRALIKISTAGLVGFVVGKYFAAKVTIKKIMTEFPDGQLVKLWKAKEAGLTGQAMLDFANNMSSPRAREVQDEVVAPNPAALRETAPTQAGLDDRFRPKVDGFEPSAQKVEEVPKKIHSYSQLRELARHERQAMNNSRSSQPEDQGRQTEEAKFFTEEDPAPPKRRVRKNQYGDEME